jgi:hypothetical protein
LTISRRPNPPLLRTTSRRGLRAGVRRMSFRVQPRAKSDDPAFARCRHRHRAVADFSRSEQPWCCAKRSGVDLDGDRAIAGVSGFGHADRGRRHPPDRDQVRRVQMIRPHHRAIEIGKLSTTSMRRCRLSANSTPKSLHPERNSFPKRSESPAWAQRARQTRKSRVSLAAKTGAAPDSDQSIQQRGRENLVCPNLSVPNSIVFSLRSLAGYPSLVSHLVLIQVAPTA